MKNIQKLVEILSFEKLSTIKVVKGMADCKVTSEASKVLGS